MPTAHPRPVSPYIKFHSPEPGPTLSITTPTNTSTHLKTHFPALPAPFLPLQMFGGSSSSLGTSLKGLGAILPWSAAAPDPQVMLEVSGDLPHTDLGVTGYGIHLSYLHEWSEHQMHIKCYAVLGQCSGRSLLLRTDTWVVGGAHELHHSCLW